MLSRRSSFIVVLLCAGLLSQSLVQAAKLQAVTARDAEGQVEIVLAVDQQTQHHVFALTHPHRWVIDLPNVNAASDVTWPAMHELPKSLNNIRGGARGESGWRVVLDLPEAMPIESFWALDQLVLRLGESATLAKQSVQALPVTEPVNKSIDEWFDQARDVVIAIDAGHGGKDPGAIGRKGTQEKEVVLAMAKQLKQQIDQTPGMRAVLTREHDETLRLRDRMSRAREHKADLFVSIHADAFHNRDARGASVYILSANGASSEAAQWLAQRENAADLVTGLKLSNKDDMLASVLLDLSQSATIEASAYLAQHVLKSLKQTANVHKSSVQHAGFVVLKSPDIPSILVETAFISNKEEEKKLRSSGYQRDMASAIYSGIEAYFDSRPIPGTRLALRAKPMQYTIEKGDTLSEIAARFDVSIDVLLAANAMNNTSIRVGQVLKIPVRG